MNRLRTDIGIRVVENEDLVNLPNWLCLDIRIADGAWLAGHGARVVSYRQELDLKCGLLTRRITFEDAAGRRSTLRERYGQKAPA